MSLFQSQYGIIWRSAVVEVSMAYVRFQVAFFFPPLCLQNYLHCFSTINSRMPMVLPGAHSTGQSAFCFLCSNQSKLYQKRPFEGVRVVHPIVPVDYEIIKSSTGAAEPHRPVRFVTIDLFEPHHRTAANKVISATGRPSQP